ncbi:MAG: hypothetical protein WB785_00780 [Mycobacterium sp.]|uniref:hypothetical protein n=1 Tax=Mycobacterium sp. TaxID=1785 RepID=UPI003C5933E3
MNKAVKKMKKVRSLMSIVLWTIAGMAGGDPAQMLGGQLPQGTREGNDEEITGRRGGEFRGSPCSTGARQFLC